MKFKYGTELNFVHYMPDASAGNTKSIVIL